MCPGCEGGGRGDAARGCGSQGCPIRLPISGSLAWGSLALGRSLGLDMGYGEGEGWGCEGGG